MSPFLCYVYLPYYAIHIFHNALAHSRGTSISVVATDPTPCIPLSSARGTRLLSISETVQLKLRAHLLLQELP